MKGGFTTSNTLVARGGFVILSFSRLLVTGVIFTKHDLTILFISLILLISQEIERLYLSIREKSRSEFFSPYFLVLRWASESNEEFEMQREVKSKLSIV